MSLSPCNRHILVEKIKERKDTESNILLPEDYKPREEEFIVVQVRDCAADCSISVSKGDKIVVPQHMVQEFSYQDEMYRVVLENHVYGILKKETK